MRPKSGEGWWMWREVCIKIRRNMKTIQFIYFLLVSPDFSFCPNDLQRWDYTIRKLCISYISWPYASFSFAVCWFNFSLELFFFVSLPVLCFHCKMKITWANVPFVIQNYRVFLISTFSAFSFPVPLLPTLALLDREIFLGYIACVSHCTFRWRCTKYSCPCVFVTFFFILLPRSQH